MMSRRSDLAPLSRVRPLPNDPTLIERLNAKIDRSGGAEACWTFTGKCQNGGYGVLHTGGKPGRTVYAHRVAWMAEHLRDPGRMAVCHTCDNPPCCNPRHLFLGTIGDNVRDMIAKGRAGTPRYNPASAARGERVGTAKITEGAVKEIRRQSMEGASSTVLGKAYGLDSSTVRQIVRRVIWRHVE